MSPLRLIRRIQAPLICLLIACLVSAGCSVKQEVVSLGKPSKAYKADNGSVLLGYLIQPTPKITLDPDGGASYAGWHWLVIEPDMVERLLTPVSSGGPGASTQLITIRYEGWGRKAELVPPLLEPGLAETTPPVVGNGVLTRLDFTWDQANGGVRLLGSGAERLPVILVTPDAATLRIREYNRELVLDILKVAAVVGVVAGLIILGGSGSIEIN